MVISYIDIAILVYKSVYRYIPPGSEDIFRYAGEKTALNRRENKQGKKILFEKTQPVFKTNINRALRDREDHARRNCSTHLWK
jgi:hypothetical protein